MVKSHPVQSAIAWLMIIAVSAFLVLSFAWISRVPQYLVLAVFGKTAPARIVNTEIVRYASFPYDGVIQTAEFRTAGGVRHQFELTMDDVPMSWHESFRIEYFPPWPAIVLIEDDPRLSWTWFVIAMLCGVPLAGTVWWRWWRWGRRRRGRALE